ncbi:MAG: pyridoxal-phosphate dependent enzyme [Sphaerochaeta sp.]|jgi:threonine synthase|nr:pyridoxal-phosphate dependent enzyme [Sphaerochaeta sp.]MCI2097013.1 pyridoxal-phosphate dependent enzyme [Sphaerochaeta sp.]
MRFTYVCNECGKVFDTDQVIYQCPDCSKDNDDFHFPKGNLVVRYDPDELRALKQKEHLSFYDFFPYPVPDKECYPVGNTPLVKPTRLITKYGENGVLLKMDSALPSGSFKDRASQLVAAQAIAHHEKKVTLASTGNAGAAMSCAGAAYGLSIVLFVPETAPVNKLMQSVLYGAEVIPVKGTYDDAFKLSLAYTKHFGGINRNTAYNPMTIEGKKSVSIELFLQLERKVPDLVYVPVGDGCIYSGVVKGFLDLRDAGLIDRLPHVICVQSRQSNAISRAFSTGRFDAIRQATTKADSISVENPASGRMAVRYLKESEGYCVEVDDAEIFDAQMELVREAGAFVEPAAACAWAGFVHDKENRTKRFGTDASACVLLTGIGFKDMQAFSGKVAIPPAIENSEEAMLQRCSR